MPCSFDEPWVHDDLCPFNAGPHWLGGYNEVSIGSAFPALLSLTGLITHPSIAAAKPEMLLASLQRALPLACL